MTSKIDKRKRQVAERRKNRDIRQRQVPRQPKQQELAIRDAPDNFVNLCRDVKTKVFSITRIRETEPGKSVFTTLGTGFLAGRHRLVTCAHVMDNKDESHLDGDRYLFIQRDEFGTYYRDVVELRLDETLYIYENIDAAIIYLPDSFYMYDGSYIRDPDDYLKLSASIHPIGTEVGVFGYPLQSVLIQDNEINMDDIYIRVDRGILNSGKNIEGVVVNEFTMAFNPGNSGGPIVDSASGKVIAYVESYTSIPIKFAKENIPEHLREDLGCDYTVTAVRALYSRGFCTTNLKAIATQHGLKLL